MKISKLQKYMRTNDVKITSVSRMKTSSGVMELVDIDNTFCLRIDPIWTSHWTKKWNTLSDEKFGEWALPKVLKWVEKLNPEDDIFHHSIHIIEG